MRVLLLGTGSADGWPNPWCRCASCTWARERGEVRTSTSALVDGRLLLDCGPDAPRQADLAGAGLADVRTILLTHAHHDHLDPAFLLARSWARRDDELVVAGPRAALDACRHWIGPRDPVRLVPLAAGDSLDHDGYVVRALAAGHDDGVDPLTIDALLYDVAAPDGARLLYATDTGPLPDATVSAVTGAAFDIALVEETFGSKTDHGTGHLDLTTFPRELVRLRHAGAVTQATDVVAVHLSHHNPGGDELTRRLAAWGARVVPDRTELVVDGRAVSPPTAAPRRRLVLGGARSGKSREAERSLHAAPSVVYVATGGDREGDDDWAERVRLHRSRRPASWSTVETLDVAAVLAKTEPRESVLVDCLALWLVGRLDATRAWSAAPGSAAYADSLAAVEHDIVELVSAVRECRAQVVLVSNEVGSGVVPEHASGRLYRDLLGALNAQVAAVCDDVDLVVAGRVVHL
jgi:adenosylcobinamide kinase/adenosylcobinamide-phosphate guanylyltransferase